ncbi:MAG: methyltransferase domain-containing protein [Gemmatimonadota bacterium]|nr:MAG: methyltransferase domain-containing protein [Gemmatimonadota bacterium]
MATTIEHQTRTASVDLERLKSKQREVWGAGDFAVVARHTVFPGELLCEAADVRAGKRVLDVATGSGNAALSAARRGAIVTGVDYVPELLDWGRKRAAAEQVAVDFEEADCEALPLANGSYDIVLSMFGAMFAPDQRRAADELVRVCCQNGRIALANWTPDGFWGRVFALQSKYIPPAAGLTPPTAWGKEDHLLRLLGGRVRVERCRLRYADFSYTSAEDWLEFFATYFGPILKAFERLDDHMRRAFAAELKDLTEQFNSATDGGLVVHAEYLEVVLTKL